MRPLLQYEQGVQGRPPHCDPLVLHAPEECQFCAAATELQEERQRLNISHTGHANRLWPCPSAQRRSLSTIHAWAGNRPYPEGTRPQFFDLPEDDQCPH